jgi:ABC-type branched-subunit amino acid transport system permease subunit
MRSGDFKETYGELVALTDSRPVWLWSLLLVAALIAAPYLLNSYALSFLTIILITVVGALGLNILTGYTGLISLGHVGFLVTGAYAYAVLVSRYGLPPLVGFLGAGIIPALASLVVGAPSLRLKGLYLAITTLAFSFIINTVILEARTVTNGAGDQDGANAGVLGYLGRRLGEIGGHFGIDRVALLRTVEAQGRDAIDEIEQHGPQGAAGLTPARGVGVLLESADTPLVDRHQMRKVCVKGNAALLALAAIAARHQQSAIGQIDKSLRFGARIEMAGDRAPGVAAHRGWTVMMTANAKRHSLGSAAGEFRVQ